MSQTNLGFTYRNRHIILMRFLEPTIDGCAQNDMMYHARLSYTQLKVYLDFALKKDLVHVSVTNNNKDHALRRYTITKKGQEVFDLMVKTQKLLE